MSRTMRMSPQTRRNWLMDAVLLTGGLLAALTGIYFLYIPSGGYQGGHNPMYGVTILFEREVWSNWHTWGGMLMIAAAAVHIISHWEWIKRMSMRTVKALLPGGSKLSGGTWRNAFINLLIGLSFLVCAVTGMYLFFAPEGGFQGGNNPGWDPGFLFGRTYWDLLHSWSGVVMIVAAVLHLAIHWRWVTKVTAKFVPSLLAKPEAAQALAQEHAR